jgi:hypothetical protein
MFLLFVSSLCVCPSLVRADPAVTDRPASCQLSTAAFGERVAEGDALFAERLQVREMEDGYAFRFPGDDDLASRLAAFVAAERRCCSFLAFELTFAAERGPIWLAMRGSPEVKALVASWVELGGGVPPTPEVETGD